MQIIALIAIYNYYSFVSSVRKDDQEKTDFGALPKLNMPQRASVQKKSFERPYRSIVNENPYISSSQIYICHQFQIILWSS